MATGTTATGATVNLGTGKLTIIGTNTSYPSGGPTVPGSSTGIGSTMTRSGTGLAPGYYGTGGYSSGPSPAQIQAARDKVLAEERLRQEAFVRDEKARKEAFSRTGGLVMPGQVNPYFTTSSNDIQTDSQAIRTATQTADQITKNNQSNVNREYDMRVGGFLNTPKNVNVIETDKGTFYGIDNGKYLDEATFKQYAESRSYSANAQTYTKQEVINGKIDPKQQTKRIKELEKFKQEEAGFEFLAGFVGGGGKQAAAIASNLGGRVVSRLTVPAAKVIAPISQPVTQATSRALGSAANDVFRLLSPAAQQTVKNIAAKPVAQKAIQTGGLLIKTEVTGEALRQAGMYTPDIAEGTYLAVTPNRLFKPTKETDVAAGKTFTATRVAYYGGERQFADDTGAIVKTEKVPGKAPMWESYAEGFVPGIKVATGFNPEFEAQTPDKIKDIPEYKALKTDKERKQYEKEYKDYYLNVGQIGGTVGQVLIETGGEVSGGGRLSVLSGGGIKTRAGAIGRFALASGTAGIQEGISTAELSAKVEQRQLSEQDKLNSALLGGTFAGGFGALQAGTMGTKYNRGVNLTGELLDFPGEPLGDVLGGQVKKVIGVPDIKIGGGMVRASYGPDITATNITQTKLTPQEKALQNKFNKMAPIDIGLYNPTAEESALTESILKKRDAAMKSNNSVKKQGKSIPLRERAMDFFFTDQSLSQQDRINKSFGISSNTNVVLPGGIIPVSVKDTTKINDKTPVKPTPVIPIPDSVPSKEPTEEVEQEEQQEQKQDVPANVPSWANIPSTVPVIAPQGFILPGFFPISLGGTQGARERTKIYDELAAAGRRFEQLSGLPFAQQETAKRKKTVMINGKEFRIGKRVKKK